MPAPTVLLIDPHTLWRVGLGLLLREGFPGLALREAPDIEDAGLPAKGVDLILIDPEAWAPALRTLESPLTLEAVAALLQRCRARWPRAALVVMIDRSTSAMLPAILAARVDGLIAKTASLEAITELLRDQLDGAQRRDGLATAGVIPGFDCIAGQAIIVPRDDDARAGDAGPVPSSEADWAHLGLSGRQLDVLRLLCAGQTNKEMSRSLGVAESTIKTHVLGLFQKLGLGSRTEAALWAAMRGLGQPAMPPPPHAATKRPPRQAAAIVSSSLPS